MPVTFFLHNFQFVKKKCCFKNQNNLLPPPSLLSCLTAPQCDGSSAYFTEMRLLPSQRASLEPCSVPPQPL